MIIDAKNSELYTEWHDCIESPETRDAFLYMVGVAACSDRFACHVQWKGQVRDFRFRDPSGRQPYAFITNQHWLLFYFRAQAVRSGSTNRDALASDFDSFGENASGEWTVKLRNIADVRRLLKHAPLLSDRATFPRR